MLDYSAFTGEIELAEKQVDRRAGFRSDSSRQIDAQVVDR
jgi:hypothetical protein